MVSVSLPSDALLQHLPSYLGFSYLGRQVSLHRCSSKAQPLLLTKDEGYLLTAALPDLQCGIAPLSPPNQSLDTLLQLTQAVYYSREYEEKERKVEKDKRKGGSLHNGL